MACRRVTWPERGAFIVISSSTDISDLVAAGRHFTATDRMLDQLRSKADARHIATRQEWSPCATISPMATINRRITASIEGDFVVFIIGARLNRWWKLPRYLWFLSSMPKMLAEVAADPKSGFLGWEPLNLTTNVQYWRSFEQLTAYSRNRDQTHYPYWVKFNKEIGSNGDIGIWHETFLVRAGEYECIYNNMPLRGLAKAGKHIDATGAARSAMGRLGLTDGSDAAVAAD